MDIMASRSQEMIADDTYKKCRSSVSKGSVADSILEKTDFGKYSPKQLWVIAYELEKNGKFSEMVGDFYAELEAKSSAKLAASRAKLAANNANYGA